MTDIGDELGRGLASLIDTSRDYGLDALINRVDNLSTDEAKATLVGAVLWIESDLADHAGI